MNPDVKKMWTTKLRSGIPQTQGVLERLDADGNVEGQCCLGVLSDCAIESGVNIIKNKSSECSTYDGMIALPTAKVMEWAEIDDENIKDLTRMNDSENKTFDEIADWIDDNL